MRHHNSHEIREDNEPGAFPLQPPLQMDGLWPQKFCGSRKKHLDVSQELANCAKNALIAGNIGRFEIRAASDYFWLLQMISQAGRKKFDDMDGMG